MHNKCDGDRGSLHVIKLKLIRFILIKFDNTKRVRYTYIHRYIHTYIHTYMHRCENTQNTLSK